MSAYRTFALAALAMLLGFAAEWRSGVPISPGLSDLLIYVVGIVAVRSVGHGLPLVDLLSRRGGARAAEDAKP